MKLMKREEGEIKVTTEDEFGKKSAKMMRHQSIVRIDSGRASKAEEHRNGGEAAEVASSCMKSVCHHTCFTDATNAEHVSSC